MGSVYPPRVEARVIGQLLTAQSVLDVIPTVEGMISFLSRVIEKVPGVALVEGASSASGGGRAANSFIRTSDLTEVGDEGLFQLTIRTTSRTQGKLDIQVENPQLFSLYKPYIINFANTAAIQLENRQLAQVREDANRSLKRAQEELEKIVSQRTRELQKEVEVRRQKEVQLRRSEARLHAMFDQAAVGIAQVDLDGRFLRPNQKFCEIVGYSAEELSRQTLFDMTHPEDLPQVIRWNQELAEGVHSQFTLEKRYVRKDGKVVWVHVTVSVVTDPVSLRPHSLIGVVNDITDRKTHEERIEYLATRDALTGLPNRNLLRDRLRHSIEHARQFGHQMAVLFLDLNRFKYVNDSLGHDKGDLLLQVIAQRLQSLVRDSDTVARLGGDEFVVILEDLSAVEQISDMAHNILKAVEEPVDLNGQEFRISTSIGGSVYPRDGEDVSTLLKHADLAMYQAKAHGGGTFRFFNAEMNAVLLKRLSIEHGLRRALKNGEFLLHYQPRVSVSSGEMVGMEALVRWQHPQRGLVSPADFIPLAEEIGLICDIGEWVLYTACRQNRLWQDAGLPKVRVSVNLSVHQLKSPRFTAMVRRILKETGLDPQWLELEITESCLMQNVDDTLETLKELREAGIALSIDDFGTGYSSLSYLKKLPIDTLKIDKSFIHDLVLDGDDAAIVQATIAMTRSMKLKVVAEGVTTLDQVRFLADHHCDEMQGYLLSRPLTDVDMEHSLRGYYREKSTH